MKKFVYFVACLLVFLLIVSKNVFADLKINEIYPAPTNNEAEWVELYNDSQQIIDLSQYKLSDLTNKSLKFSQTQVDIFGFVIATSSSVLNNDTDTVFLKNTAGEIVDVATYSGNFDSTKTFASCPDGSHNWLLTTFITKNTSNNGNCPSPTPTPVQDQTPTPAPSLTPTPQPTITPTAISLEPQTIGNIFLSEVLPNPEDGNEWVELYNNNSYEVILTDWYIDDAPDSGSAPKKFSLTLSPLSYATIELSSAIFNNSGDTVRLLQPDKSELESFEYTSTTKGKSFSKQGYARDTNWCLTTPSKNLPNNSCEQTIQPINNTTTVSISPTNINSSSSNQTSFYQPQNLKEPQQLKIRLQTTRLKPTKTTSVLGETTNKDITGFLQTSKHYFWFLKITFSFNLLLSFCTLCYMIYIYHDFFKEVFKEALSFGR